MFKRVCITCSKLFETNHPLYRNCSKKCNGIHRVNQRYRKYKHNWSVYFRDLLCKKKNSSLIVDDLIYKIAMQDYRCALSGMELTCYKVRGTVILTNASIDRINAGKEYNYDNIQLVCRAVNSFRSNLAIGEFIFWCTKVSKYGICKQTQTLQKGMATRKEKKRKEI
tara:strand:- start:254 stop:754 length:501 start_codon:yes stop_codon:yes gene_type:complete